MYYEPEGQPRVEMAPFSTMYGPNYKDKLQPQQGFVLPFMHRPSASFMRHDF